MKKSLTSVLLVTSALCAMRLAPSALAQTPTTVVTTNSAGQVVITSSLTNMDQLLAALKSEVAANAPAAAGTFAATALGYFSSFNTNFDSTFALTTNFHGYAWAGVDSLQGGSVNLANSIGIDYRIWGGLALDELTRNSGVSGTLVSQSAGLAFNLPIHDVNIAAFAHGGYDFTILDTDLDSDGKSKSKFYGEIGIRAMKALTTHTFAGVGISEIFPGSRQSFTAFAGFTF